MTTYAKSPTREPYDELLTAEQMAAIAVRKAAVRAHWHGVPLDLALAEIRYGYKL
jgi:hypothetical protein